MREVVVAVYDAPARAEEAVLALEAAQIPSGHLRRYHKEDGGVQSQGGFWDWLMGENKQSDWRDPGYGDKEEKFYSWSLSSGNIAIAVYVSQDDCDRVMQILEDHHPIGTHVEPSVADSPEQDRSQAVAAAEAVAGSGQVEQEKTIPLTEEQVRIGKRHVSQSVRVHRYVVERPVEQDVVLRDERVEIERRPVQQPANAGGSQFEERTVEVHETHEVPIVEKTATVTEEVVVRKTGSERVEHIRDTARKEEVDIERKDEVVESPKRAKG